MQGMVPAEFTEGSSGLIVTAIHAGTAMRPSLEALCGLENRQRFREEDPFTDGWTRISDNRIVGLRSRFEVDLNRARDKSVYRVPADCWGLEVWNGVLPDTEIALSLAAYDAFYAATGAFVERLLSQHARVMIYDLHSYNHQRQGPGIDDDPEGAPEINLGTANIDRGSWGPVLDVLSTALRKGPDGREYDVRENVRFKGGHFSCWLNQRFGPSVCPVAIEFKKVFMNEWTGEPDAAAIERIRSLLAASIAPVMRATNTMEHA
jgi:N-formylglutamate deformylase